MDDFRLQEPVPSEGLICRACGKPLDTKTTVTMLCKSCKHKKSPRIGAANSGLERAVETRRDASQSEQNHWRSTENRACLTRLGNSSRISTTGVSGVPQEAVSASQRTR